MDTGQLEERITDRGRAFFSQLGRRKSSVFSLNSWIEKMMEWSMERENFKLKLFGLLLLWAKR